MGKPLGIIVAFGLALSLAACGSDDAPERATGDGASPPSETYSFPVTVEGTNGEITIDERPVRIVSLSPTATEDLFAIGAGDAGNRGRRPVELPARSSDDRVVRVRTQRGGDRWV